MTPPGARATASDLDESMVAAGDLWQYGPDADPDPKNVGTMALLSFYVDPEGAVSLDIYGGRGDRRLLINGELRAAMKAAGISWVT